MALTLTVRSGPVAAPSLTLDLPKALLGRSTGCDLVLPDPSVSHRHASIRQRGNEYIVLDEGSTNGTFVGPVRLSEGTPRVLKTGDLIRLGRVWVEVTIEQAMANPNARDLTKEIALRLIEGALTQEGQGDRSPKVVVSAGKDLGKVLLLERFNAPYVVGRSKQCDLPLEDDDCSRRHVEIVRRGLRIWLRDLGSKNGATLDGQAVGEVEQPWQPGLLVNLGRTELSLSDPVTSLLAELETTADEVVEGSVEPPEVLANDPKPEVVQERPAPAAKIVSMPRRTSEGPPPPRRATWTSGDVLVLLLALLVLAVSAGGMLWLF